MCPDISPARPCSPLAGSPAPRFGLPDVVRLEDALGSANAGSSLPLTQQKSKASRRSCDARPEQRLREGVAFSPKKRQAVRMLAERPLRCGHPRLEAARRSHPRRAGSDAGSPPTHSRRRSVSMNGQRWTLATYALCFRHDRPESHASDRSRPTAPGLFQLRRRP
jgi:hypothetical protein